MKNLDILIFNGIVILAFITFFISTFRIFEKTNKSENYISTKPGIISRFLAYLESLVAE
jgi:hypothetical protein